MSEPAEDRTKRLENLLIQAALDLLDGSARNSFVIPVPHTTPPIHIAVGDSLELETLARSIRAGEQKSA